MAIPPGVSAADWTESLKQFTDVAGSRWVFTSDEDIALYRDAYSPFWGEPEERLVSAAVAPDSADQVSRIVKIANRYRIPLFSISTGKNLGYGGSAGNISGTVIVDLKRMNRVIEVDDERYFGIVEPGVAYFDLYRHIQDHHLKVWIDTPDPGWGSVVGNSLDHGVGYTYGVYRDHFHSHCGLEVVMPDGEIVRTGMGALPGAKTWGEYRYGFGPTLDGLFAQGNVGIVTKMGFHLLPPRMKTIAGATLALLLLARPETANAQNRTAVDAGRDLYQYSCAICHGRGSGNPGTVALQAKYGAQSPALLEDRTDLTAGTVRFFVRRGASIMPFFRKTEISDTDLDAIAAYLTRPRGASPATPAGPPR